MTIANKIDVVITWVDGDDPAHTQKRISYLSNAQEHKNDDIAGITRFRSVGEIDYCVASIIKFAPFINRIFIVTDNQDPNVEETINKFFPDNTIPIEIVDHKVLFEGYEQYLPTFNSLSIETMLHRIPGLSENFVYLNDDFLLLSPVSPKDWFVDDKIVTYGYWHFTCTARFMQLLGRLKVGHTQFKFRDSMLNSACLLGGKSRWWRFVRIMHTPLALKKSVIEEFYAKNPQALVANIKHRFRHKSQFNPQSLVHTMLAHKGKCIITPNLTRDHGSIYKIIEYIKPSPNRLDKFKREYNAIKNNEKAKFLCVNSLDQGTPDQQRLIVNLIRQRIGMTTLP
ncbi:MAG: Stealth CR1 domain-containing protein [Rikenellaceae bacterium]